MYLTEKKRAVLQILADNIAMSRCPEAVDSEKIAELLDISMAELVGILKNLDETGMIVSSVEHNRSIITREGLVRLYGRVDQSMLHGECVLAI